jgi:hypothetical protein
MTRTRKTRRRRNGRMDIIRMGSDRRASGRRNGDDPGIVRRRVRIVRVMMILKRNGSIGRGRSGELMRVMKSELERGEAERMIRTESIPVGRLGLRIVKRIQARIGPGSIPVARIVKTIRGLIGPGSIPVARIVKMTRALIGPERAPVARVGLKTVKMTRARIGPGSIPVVRLGSRKAKTIESIPVARIVKMIRELIGPESILVGRLGQRKVRTTLDTRGGNAPSNFQNQIQAPIASELTGIESTHQKKRVKNQITEDHAKQGRSQRNENTPPRTKKKTQSLIVNEDRPAEKP